MRQLPFLADGDDFPPTCEALDEPNGLLAAGANLTPQRLVAAYRRGIFPWYEEPQPVLWWTPDPRSVLLPGELHVSRSLRKVLRRDALLLGVDTRFGEVIQACAAAREDGLGTWIGRDMRAAYQALHAQGLAHSVEVLNREGALVGGLYGVAVGRVFFGESMFSRARDTSKVALVALVNILRRGEFKLIDCQVGNPHLQSLGARNIPRLDFEALLAQTTGMKSNPGAWQLPASCGGLL